MTLPDVHAATTLPPREANVRTTVSGAGVEVAVGRGLDDDVGFELDVPLGLALGFSVGFELGPPDDLVEAGSGRVVAAGLAVANRADTSPAVSTGIDAGVTALPNICTAIQPLTTATTANAAQRAADVPRDPRMTQGCLIPDVPRDTGPQGSALGLPDPRPADTLGVWRRFWWSRTIPPSVPRFSGRSPTSGTPSPRLLTL